MLASSGNIRGRLGCRTFEPCPRPLSSPSPQNTAVPPAPCVQGGSASGCCRPRVAFLRSRLPPHRPLAFKLSLGVCRERIRLLLDPGSPFLELSQLAGRGLYGEWRLWVSVGVGVGWESTQPNHPPTQHQAEEEDVAGGGIVPGVGTVPALPHFPSNQPTPVLATTHPPSRG